MIPNNQTTSDEPFDPLSDTDRKVGLIVRRIKEELEMHRAMMRDEMQQVFSDVLKSDREKSRNLLYEIFTWLAGKFKR